MTPTCRTHHIPLVCPACQGAKGGGKTSPRKAAAAAENAKLASAKRWPDKGGNALGCRRDR